MSLRKVELILLGTELGLVLSDSLDEAAVFRIVDSAASKHSYDLSDYSKSVAEKYNVRLGTEPFTCFGCWEEGNALCSVCPDMSACLTYVSSGILPSYASSAYTCLNMEDPLQEFRETIETQELPELKEPSLRKSRKRLHPSISVIQAGESSDSSDPLVSYIEENHPKLSVRRNKHAVSFLYGQMVVIKVKLFRYPNYIVRFPLMDSPPDEEMQNAFRVGSKYWVSKVTELTTLCRIIEHYLESTGLIKVEKYGSGHLLKETVLHIHTKWNLRAEYDKCWTIYAQDGYPVILLRKFEIGRFKVSFCRIPNYFSVPENFVQSKHGYDYRGKNYTNSRKIVDHYLGDILSLPSANHGG